MTIRYLKNSKNKQSQVNNKIFVILGSIVIVWLITLTIFAVDAWYTQNWQAKYDSEAIYKLMIENGEQQVKIEQLQEKD